MATQDVSDNINPSINQGLDSSNNGQASSRKLILLCLAIIPTILLVLAAIFYTSFLVTHQWDYFFNHPEYLMMSVVGAAFVICTILMLIVLRNPQKGMAALYKDRPEELAIYQKLTSIQDKEERKKEARKIMDDRILKRPWLNETAQRTIIADQNKGNWVAAAFVYVKEYIKSAWQGKVRFMPLFIFWFLLIPKGLGLVVQILPIFTVPIAIVGIPYLIWWFVSAWQCAFNDSKRRWVGYVVRTFFVVLPIFGILMALLGLILPTKH